MSYKKNNPDILKKYQSNIEDAIRKNTWSERVKLIKLKFEEILLKK